MILEGIYQIGKIQNINFLDNLIEEIDTTRYRYLIKIKLKKQEEKYIFEGIDFEEISNSKKIKYCLIDGPSNGPSKTPVTLCLVERNNKDIFSNRNENLENHINNIIEKKLIKKILPSIRSFIESFHPIENNKSELEKIDSALQNNIEKIKSDLKKFLEENQNIRLSDKIIIITFLTEKGEEYPGDFIPIKETLESQRSQAFVNYYIKNNIESKWKNENEKKYCYYCHELKNEVWGYASPFTFYTVDKESFVSGGFKSEFSWKNYPVCPDCAVILHKGEKYLSENLSFKFAGYSYLLIPQLLLFEENQMKELLDNLSSYCEPTLNDKKMGRIERIEEDFLSKLGEEKNLVNFNFMFYEKNNNQFNILLLIQEIPPSRLKKLIEAKYNVDQKYKNLFPDIETKKSIINFDFHFGFIFDFFKSSKNDNVEFKKSGLEILRNIFYLKPISFKLLIERFLAKIRGSINNINEEELEFFLYCLKSLKILLYMEELGILDRRRYKMEVKGLLLEDFLNQFPILDEPTKKAVFLEGVLALKLLNIQYQQSQSKPFYSRLNGLKIDEKIAKRLLPEMINKLEEYDKNYYKELEEAISFYFTKSNFNDFTVDELSFYFALGLSLGKEYKKEDKKEENNG